MPPDENVTQESNRQRNEIWELLPVEAAKALMTFGVVQLMHKEKQARWDLDHGRHEYT